MKSEKEATIMRLPQNMAEEKKFFGLLPFVFFINNNDQNL